MVFPLLILLFIYLSASQNHCVKLLSPNHCVECESNYYLQLTDNEETGIPTMACVASSTVKNCASFENNACIKCETGFYLTGNECVGCGIANCNYCNSTHCYQCAKVAETQYYLSIDEKTCIDCTLSENDVACGRCNDGQYFNTQSKSCKSCFTNCQLCTEEFNCYQCANGTLLNKQITPSKETPDKCEELSHCTLEGTKGDHCELCKTGYRLQGGNCEKCNDNCDVCYKKDDGKSYCSVCSDTYVWVKGECKSATEIHCKKGSTTYGCLECDDEYFLDSSFVCSQCDKTCNTCIEIPTHCLTCQKDYYFESGTKNCKLKDPHCNLVDQAGCKECINDLTTDEGKNTTGYFVPPESQVCVDCTNHCKLCEGKDYHCTACTSDYVLNKTTEKAEDGVTDVEYYECTPMGETCVKTEMGYCTECKNGFFIQGVDSQDCIKCDKSCGTCKVSTSCLTCHTDYYMSKEEQSKENVEHLCKLQTEINMTCKSGMNGCETCKDGYYINRDDPSQYNCTVCPEECSTCTFKQTDSNDLTVGYPVCTGCRTEQEYVNDGKCKACSELKNCAACSGEKCVTCVEGYNIDAGGISCSKTNWALIIPLVVVGVIIIVLIFIAIIAIIWWRRAKSVKAETAAIKPFHVGSDLELLLLGADNEKFPLKTDKWELTFGLQKAKAVVDTEYTETINLANMSKSQYYFEFHYTPSHKYDLEIEPKSATLKPSTAIPVTFKIKMLCTTSVSDNIGISAMDIDDQNKETAKFTIVVESDLSLKLDHTELKPIMPPIGEGAFGMVFRGTYRGRDVAIKKMKARNLTQEQEKEFNHEVSMMTQLRQNCVVELIGAVYTEGEIAIVTEFAEYGSLSKIWGKNPMNYQLKVKVLDDMVVALNYLHQNSILHRDVKGENLLVFSLNPHSPVCAKLTDFGTCRNISERNLQSKALSQGIGTPTYMAPECLQNSSEYSYPVDVYAFGIVLYETYIEKNAYENDERFNQPWMIPQFVIEGNRLDKPTGIPENYWDLTTKCWKQNPEERPTFADILATIESWGEDIRYALSVEGENKQ
ncbi:hypothetical protein EIN_296330 [Entamoeba invadens IP1]|uniref:Protein kinase domain-containing protein n=1 Tax=Entamoeba invadens IP1 TaxID=370355 RepID=L7FKE0_ENTIV|nr:hypothetical protein EIN_296330 [Entamoeba invadens IP1]ELP86333.1 hypothetical protein EIN_296330 [Entamoeba invadens IP1]|eukprot:XP_004185679.1 hypothetical protein EIN_296330 [Entamoeba invadens IP1]